jgi:murein L,D-transpeptidase YcbB/YkuD
VGKPEAQTPSFRDYMEYLVFNPTWTVPPSIEKKYKGVPAGYKRVKSGGRYYLVQPPGPRNALGRVKFMFPNGHAIYLHDTPSKGLFSHTTRAYSHGCIRVQNPLKLAEVLLDKPAWGQAEINRVLSRNRTRDVRLDEHIPVLLYYLTAKVDENGKLGYRKDVYGRDGRLARAIAGPPSPLRIAFPEEAPIPLPEPAPALEPPGEGAEGPAIEGEPATSVGRIEAKVAPSPLDSPLASSR